MEHVEPEPIWLIVANVCRARPYGESHEPKAGLRWLNAGAKVFVPGGFGGMGFESVTVIGQHRLRRRLFLQHVQSRYLVNWRVKLVYSPAVLRLVAEGEYQPFRYGDRRRADGSAEYRAGLEKLAASFAAREVSATLFGGPCDGETVTLGPGEPPGQLLMPVPAHPTDGVRYLRRAWDGKIAYYDHTPSEREAP
jgi:hypothetical protein